MSRIRSIKPEWLDDELLATASGNARALSVALICLADDYGNGRAGRMWLAARAFPGKPPETLDAALDELARMRYVYLYELESQRYFSIRTWEKNQRVDKPGQPKVPRPNLANIENDSERITLPNSQEFPASVQESPEKSSPRAIPSHPISGSVPSSDPDPTSKPGSVRARGAAAELKPFLMHDGWEPEAEFVAAQALKYEAPEARVRALLPEFRTYWKSRDDRKIHRYWLATFAKNVARAAKLGELYVVPLGQRDRPAASGAGLTPEQRARVAQREADLAKQAEQRKAELLGGANG